MVAPQYFEYCTQPRASSKKYWKKNWLTGRRRYQHGRYTQDIRKYNQCLRQSKYGRAKAEFEAGCAINSATGKVDCSIQTGHTNTGTIPGSVGQVGLGHDKGKFMEQLAGTDKTILIGAAIVLFLLVR